MVGFPSAQVREAQERVRTAFKNNRLCLPPKKVTVNFAPADMKKEGAGFDLPVAAAVLAAAKRAGLTLLRYSGGKYPGGESGEGYAGVWSKKSE